MVDAVQPASEPARNLPPDERELLQRVGEGRRERDRVGGREERRERGRKGEREGEGREGEKARERCNSKTHRHNVQVI